MCLTLLSVLQVNIILSFKVCTGEATQVFKINNFSRVTVFESQTQTGFKASI